MNTCFALASSASELSGAIGRHISKSFASAATKTMKMNTEINEDILGARNLLRLFIYLRHIRLVSFVPALAEAFGLWTDQFAIHPIFILPRYEHPIVDAQRRNTFFVSFVFCV